MNKCYLLIQVLLRLLHAVGKVVLRKFIGVVHIFDDTHVRGFALCECSAHEPGPLLCPRSSLEIYHLFGGPLSGPEDECINCAGSIWGSSCKPSSSCCTPTHLSHIDRALCQIVAREPMMGPHIFTEGTILWSIVVIILQSPTLCSLLQHPTGLRD